MVLTREYIEEAFRTPVRRERLKYVLGCGSDREARNMVSRLQAMGYNIINLQGGDGYVLGTDEQVRKYALQEMKRARNVYQKAGNMLKRCTISDGIQIPVRAHFRTIRRRTEVQNQMSMEDVL